MKISSSSGGLTYASDTISEHCSMVACNGNGRKAVAQGARALGSTAHKQHETLSGTFVSCYLTLRLANEDW